MLFELWGATEPPRLLLPERPIGYLLLALYLLLLFAVLYRQRQQLRKLSGKQWALTGLLVAMALLFSRLFPISALFDNQLPLPGSARNPTVTLIPFGALPFLLAGAVLNPAAAALVGFTSGLGRALWGSYQFTDPFHFALAAYLAALWLQRRYNSTLHGWLQRPFIAGPISLSAIAPLLIPATLVYINPAASGIVSLDAALSLATANLPALVLEGGLSGILVALILLGAPILKPPPRILAAPPYRHSLRKQLLSNFAAFVIILLVTILYLSLTSSVRVATNLVIQQMERDGKTASAQIPDFLYHREHILVEASRNPALLGDNAADKQDVLRQIHRTGNFYRRVILLSSPDLVVDFHPPEEGGTPQLTSFERALVQDALQEGRALVSHAQPSPEGFILSFVVPVYDANRQPQAVLLGQTPAASINDLNQALQGTLGRGEGFIVDDRGQIIAHPDPSRLLTTWTPPQEGYRQLFIRGEALRGQTHEGRNSVTNARELIYYLSGEVGDKDHDHPWTVVITMPYEVALAIALQISGQLALTLAIALLLFGVSLIFTGRRITRPLNELVQATQSIASGRLNTVITVDGEDEVAQLGRSIGQMQSSLRQRLDELSLLLSVSQTVSASLDLNQGMPIILQSALRATGAAGVSAVVLNPSARQPFIFGEGPLAKTMSQYNRQIMALLRRQENLVLHSPTEVQMNLDQTAAAESEAEQGTTPVIKALVAMPLYSSERFQGVFWLGYRQPHQFGQEELNLLQTLAGQISVLVENTRLFATAESGRRRLAAVLSSTADAVIVTDQTEHILLINPAMERAFNLSASEAVGRRVKDVISNKRLAHILTSDVNRLRNLEIVSNEGKTLYASASTIASAQGLVMGRVAVLHDITALKEVDKMKSEFVNTVSHDLRSPLTYMRGYATMMPMAGALNDKQAEYVEKILTGIEQMSALVNDLLDLGRLEAGVALEMGEVNVRSLLIGVVDELRHPAQSHGLYLSLDAPPNLPTAPGDEALIRQAARNLVNNTMKYAPDSGNVTIGATQEGEEIVIWVRDHGPGISKRDQVRLFEKFYRVKSRQNAAVKGSGLGLSIVRTIAERHGGRAWCRSELGEGSAFYFSLPLKRG